MRQSSVTRAWDLNADAWARFVRHQRDPFREHLIWPALRRFMGDVAGRRVLDAGCGEGIASRWLARAGAQVEGTDCSPRLIEIATAQGSPSERPIRYFAADMSNAGALGRPRFDLVLMCQTLMALPDVDGAVAEAGRVLKRDGRLVVVLNHPSFVIPNDGPYLRQHVLRWKFFPGQSAQTALYHRPLETYVDALARAGLAITRMSEPRAPASLVRQIKDRRSRRESPVVMLLEARKFKR